jgi:hypothetical protein
MKESLTAKENAGFARRVPKKFVDDIIKILKNI